MRLHTLRAHCNQHTHCVGPWLQVSVSMAAPASEAEEESEEEEEEEESEVSHQLEHMALQEW